MFDARGTSSSNTLVNEFQVQLDSSVLVVPVYVHILRDKNGNPPTANPTANPPVHTYDATFTIGTLPTQVNPTKDEQIAWNMGQLFDPTTVRYPYWPIVLRSTFAEGVPEKILDPSAKRTDTLSGSNGGTVEVPTIADDIFGQCEQFPPFRPVQLRLMGVSFIRQGLGLEKLLLPASTAPSSCQFVGDPPLCGIGGTPAGTLGQQIVATYDAAAPGVPRGIHVIVGGAIFPVGGPVMMNCGGPTSGFSCMHSRFALIDGSGSGNSDGRFYVQTIFHEIGHLLTLNGNHDDGDPHNLMASHADRDNGLLTASQCAQIVNQAGRY
jgi:hypothetical protein